MRKKKGMIVITLAAVIVGIMVSLQLTMAEGANPSGLISIAKVQKYEDELKKVQAEKEVHQQKLNALEASIREIEQAGTDTDDKLKGIMAEQDQYKLAAGVVDVEGPGLEITINDPDPAEGMGGKSSDWIQDNFDELPIAVNKLKEAGAEAVSINEQRIISRTDIMLIGDHLNVNNVPIASPYVIKAIGDPDKLEAMMNVKYGILYVMRNNLNLKIDVKKKDKLVIPRYSGQLRFRYASPVTEDGTSGNGR